MDYQKATERKGTDRPSEKKDDSNSNNNAESQKPVWLTKWGSEIQYYKQSTAKSSDQAPSNSKKE